MLVQRQAPKRLRNLLIAGAIIITPLLGYVVYLNFFSADPTSEVSSTKTQKKVPTDFGQNFFRDPRFNALVPKQGTALIAQSAATVPGDMLPPPHAVQAFDMQTGGTVLFIWKRPDGAEAATGIRLNRVVGGERSNIAALPATATSFQYREASDGVQTGYELQYIVEQGVEDTPAVQARAGATSGTLTVAAASADGVKLTWTKPAGEFTAVEVYRSSTVGELGMRIAHLGADDTSFEDSTGRPGLYFYLVRWVASSVAGQVWQGKVTSTDNEAPAAPQAITAKYVDPAQDSSVDQPLVRVTWSPSPSPDVVAYDIFRSPTAMSLGTKIGQKAVRDIASLEAIASNPNTAKLCANQYCLEDKSFAPGSGTVKGIPYYYTAVAIDAAGNQSSLQDLSVPGRSNPFIPL